MALEYRLIKIFTSEEVRHHGRPAHEAVIELIRRRRIAARCIVTRGLAGSFENGEVATQKILLLSQNMPIKIEIMLPAGELEPVLPAIQEMITDGIVIAEPIHVVSYRTSGRLVPRHLRVQDVMTASPETISPTTSVKDVIQLLLSGDFNAIPVVDAGKHPVGIITQGDLLARADMPVRIGLLDQFGQHRLEAYLDMVSHIPAEKVMTRPVVTVEQDKSLADAVNLMLKHNFKRLPVIDKSGAIVGILARVDIFRAISRETPEWKAFHAQNVDVANLRLVRDIMRRDTHTVAPEAPVEQVIRMIGTNDIQRVAVVDAGGKLLGIISDRDLLAAFSDSRESIWHYLAGRRTHSVSGQVLGRTAADIMRKDLVTIQEDTTVDGAIRLMTDKSLKRLPVVDAEGRFKGMISRDSLLRTGLVSP